MAVLGCMLSTPPLKKAAEAVGCLPSPGSGPSIAAMDQGYLKLTAYGTGKNGKQSRCCLYFPDDPAYRDTARMLVEAGLGMALDEAELPEVSGVVTPIVALGDNLKSRLVATGTVVETS